MKEKDAIDQVVRLMTEQDSLNEQIKEILDEAKASELDHTSIKAVATAIVKNSVDKLQKKSENILSAIDTFRS